MYTASKQAATFRDSKRNRRPTSCEQCRLRKYVKNQNTWRLKAIFYTQREVSNGLFRAKCNRELPCEACIKRGERSACKYANNAIRHFKAVKSNGNNNGHSTNNSNVGERLQRVENLVFELISGRGSTMDSSTGDDDSFANGSSQPGSGDSGASRMDTTTTHDDGEMGKSIPRPTVENSTHWLSILDDIKEVREQLSQSGLLTPEDNDIPNEEEEMDLVLGPMELPKFQDIIQSLPPRPVCDKMLAQYFNSPLILRMFCHILLGIILD
jgi:hypothetical protein